MDIKTAKALVKHSDSDGKLELDAEYCGRGIQGNKTAAIIGNTVDWYYAIGEVMVNGTAEEASNVSEYLQTNVRQDNLGLVMIWY